MPEVAESRPLEIVTVGHSNQTVERLLSLLAAHAIDVLVDVRSAPYSRYATQFNWESLEPVVTRAGLRYLFMGEELGGRQLGTIHELDERLRRYGELAAQPAFRRGLERLVAGAARHRIAILSAEEDPTECHRRVWVGRALAERGVVVHHLRGDGRLDAESALRRVEPPAGEQLSLFDA